MSAVLEAFVSELSRESGYSEGFLGEMLNDYMNDMAEDGEDLDFGYFVGVTMERDW